MENNCRCPICGDIAEFNNIHNLRQGSYDCRTCGGFSISHEYQGNIDKNILAHFLYYNCNLFSHPDNKQCFYYIGNQTDFNIIHNVKPNSILRSFEEILNWYPKNFSEKIDYILLALDKLSDYIGKSIFLEGEMVNSLFFVKRYADDKKYEKGNLEEQLEFFTSYMVKQELIKKDANSITLLPCGLSRIDELQKNQSESKQVFVAMAFSEDMKVVQEKIEKGIERAYYIPHVMNRNKHNNQIVPEILFQIRQSKFVVAEFSTNNNGAYYEAGYAAGLGKEVIHVCNDDKFKEEGHFDIKQKSTVLWKSVDEISDALFEHIEATIGKGK